MQKSSFRWCSFYGLSAPLVLTLSQEQIDTLFGTPLSHEWSMRLQSLYWELEKLNKLISNPQNMHTVVDESSNLCRYFLNGLNRALYELASVDKEQSESVIPDVDLTLDSSLDDALNQALEMDSNTNLFGNESNTTSEVQIDDSELDNMLPDDLLSDLTEDMGVLLEEAPQAVDTSNVNWVLPDSLIAYGKTQDAEVKTFNSLSEVNRWIISDAQNQLGEDNYKSLISQINKLPRKLSGRCTIDSKTHRLDEEYPELYSIMNTILTQANYSVDGITKIQYVMNLIQQTLDNSSVSNASFLGVRYDLLRKTSNTYIHNVRINQNIVDGPITTQSVVGRLKMIDKLLKDCEILLGVETENNNLRTAMTELSSIPITNTTEFLKLLGEYDIVPRSFTSESWASELIDDLRSKFGDYNPMIHNLADIAYLLQVRRVIHELDTTLLLRFELQSLVSDPDILNDLGVQLAKMFGICGVYSGIVPQFRQTMTLTDTIIENTDKALQVPSDEDYFESSYLNVQLIYTYLLSMKTRLTLDES